MSAAASPGHLFAGVTDDAHDLWYRRMRRCAQHNFNEYDPQVLDINAWLDYWESLKVNALVLTGGGFMAFYPTRLPAHHKSQFLGDRDLFGDYLKAARKRGIRVVARIETNWLHEEVLKLHPEWFERDENGDPSPNEESRYAYHTCVFSDYHERQVPAIMREIASLYDVDGFFTNSWPSTGSPRPCYCVNCQRFGKRTRSQLQQQYQTRIVELCRGLATVAKEKRADRVYNVNIEGGINAVQSIRRLAEVGDWLTADHQGRAGGDKPIWDCSQQGRVAYSAMLGKPVTNVVTGNAHSWRHTSKIGAELELWLAQTTASGMIPWLVWMGGAPEDRRWQQTGRSFYQWLANHEKHFYNRQPMSNLGVVYSQRMNYLYNAPGATPGGYGARLSRRPAAPGDPSDHLQGLYYALLEGRFIFDFLHEDDLTVDSLKRYSVVLLPNIALLSGEQCSSLRAFVEGGGSLLATFETGLYDQSGKQRNEFGLADVFGIQRAGERQGAVFYAEKRRTHEILRDFPRTTWVPAGEWRVPLKSTTDSVLTVVPPYPRGIPEMVYAHARSEMPYAGPHSNEPALVLRERGRSRCAYFPSDIDRCTWVYGNSDLSQLLINAIRWVSRDPSPVSVTGEGMAEVIAWETEPGFAIHILNYNNPNMTRPWIRKHYPLGPQRVRVLLPEGVTITGVELLRDGTRMAPHQNGRLIELTVPTVRDYEVVALYRA
jgi:hypothetical protein